MKKHFTNGFNNIRNAFRALCGRTNADNNIMLTQLSALSDETINDAEVYQQFGFTSNLPKNTQCIVLPLGGKTAHSVVVATENGAFRVKSLPRGAVCVYDEKGSKITLSNDGKITLDAEQFIVNAKSVFNDDVQVNAKTNTTGQIISQSDVQGNGVSLTKHTHPKLQRGQSDSPPPKK